jgi:uncharacterized membrane protein YqjE
MCLHFASTTVHAFFFGSLAVILVALQLIFYCCLVMLAADEKWQA